MINRRLKHVKQNVNLLEFPLWTINKDDKRFSFIIKTDNGAYNYISNPIVGIPDSTDMTVLYYILYIAQKGNGCSARTTFYDICKNMGLQKSGRTYDRVKQSLRVWRSVSVDFDGNYYCKSSNETHISIGFNILNFDIKILNQSNKNIIEVELNDKFVDSLKMAGMFDLIDFNLFVKLRNPLAKRIYEYLPKHFIGEKTDFIISDNLLFDKLRLQKRQYRSEIIRQFCSIKNALSIYNEAQDVNEFELKYKQKNNSKTEFICVFKKKNKNINDVQTLELKIKEEDLKKSETIDTELYKQLIHYGIKSIQISEFINNPDIGIDGVSLGYNYFKQQLNNGKVNKNKTAYLANSILKGWGNLTEEQQQISDKTNTNTELKNKVATWKNRDELKLKDAELEQLETEIEQLYKKIGNPNWHRWQLII